jgi:precorrin-6B methylase 1
MDGGNPPPGEFLSLSFSTSISSLSLALSIRKMDVKIYVARHGQDTDNANGILNGRRDEQLTELGKQQAKDVARKMSEAGFRLFSPSSSSITTPSSSSSSS